MSKHLAEETAKQLAASNKQRSLTIGVFVVVLGFF